MSEEEKLNAIKEIKEDSKVLEFVANVMQEKEDLQQEIERLNNIIEEAIEYIVHPTFKGTHSTNEEVLLEILRILKGE